MLNPLFTKRLNKAGAMLCVLLSISLPATTYAATYLNATTLHSGGDSARVLDIVYVPVGYDTASQAEYEAHVAESTGFLSLEPFDLYGSHFNVHRVNAISDLSEEDALRSLVIANLPDVDRFIFIHRDRGRAFASFGRYVRLFGGSPSSIGGANGMGGDTSVRVTAHELGHAIGSLADEYFISSDLCSGSATSEVYTGAEPFNANVTINEDMSSLKWANWLDLIGLPREGGLYCTQKIWRPTDNSIMRRGSAYGPVGREEMIRKLNRSVASIVSSSSSQLANGAATINYGDIITFSVTLDPAILPQGVPPKVQWLLEELSSGGDIRLLPGETNLTYTLDTTKVQPGILINPQVSISDADPRDFIRNNNSNFERGMPVGTARVNRAAWVFRVIPPPASLDYDGDSVLNASDNCLADINPDQLDSDGDGRGDVCDSSPFSTGTITGKVKNAVTGQGISGALVIAFGNKPGASGVAVSDSNGAYIMKDAKSAADYRVVVFVPDGYIGAGSISLCDSGTSQRTLVADATLVENCTLDSIPRVMLSGRITFGDGSPVFNRVVSIFSDPSTKGVDVTTDANGNYNLEVPDGFVFITVPGTSTARIQNMNGQDQILDIVMSPVQVTGVIKTSTGAPFANKSFNIGSIRNNVFTVTTDAAGTYSVKLDIDGYYTDPRSAPGYSIQGVDIGPSSTIYNFFNLDGSSNLVKNYTATAL